MNAYDELCQRADDVVVVVVVVWNWVIYLVPSLQPYGRWPYVWIY